MMMIEPGKASHTQQSWREPNPREVLDRVVHENPNASADELRTKFRDEITDPYIPVIVDYWFNLNYRRHVIGSDAYAQRAQAKLDRKREVQKVASEILSKIILLDVILPGTDKKLRDCTGTECEAVGGWLTKVGRTVGPINKVGDVLSEEQLRELQSEE